MELSIAEIRSQLAKKIFIIIGFVIIYAPCLLSMMKLVTALDFDIPLRGYAHLTPKPDFEWESFLDGEFQAELASWLSGKIRPRGVATKIYATLRYNLFNLGNRPIGYNHDIFEMEYINAELVINDTKDLAGLDNQEMMAEYVSKLVSVQNKLGKCGKILYVCITPSKADFHYDNILNKYKRISDESAVKPIDYFSELISETGIPYIICRDKRGELEYPAFYTTGIHWSRTFEQKISAEILEELSSLTGKRYRKMVLGDAIPSELPFWRDADVYNLLNVLNKADDQTYYEYEVMSEQTPDEYDRIRILLQGTSFGEGIQRDILLMAYPGEEVYFLNRNICIEDSFGNLEEINESWEDFNLGRYLDDVDAVVIETTEAELTQYSYGFVDYMNTYLDAYMSKSAR